MRAWVLTAMAALLVAACARGGREEVAIMDASVDGTTVSMTVASCNANPTAAVQESQQTVVITVTADRPGPDGEDCADGVTAELSEPLGSRSLIDGSNEERVQVNVEPRSD